MPTQNSLGFPLLALDIHPDMAYAYHLSTESEGFPLVMYQAPCDGYAVLSTERGFAAQGVLSAMGVSSDIPLAAVMSFPVQEGELTVRETFFRQLFSESPAISPAVLFGESAAYKVLRLSQIQSIAQVSVTDTFCAAVLGAFATSMVRERSLREGVVIAHIEGNRVGIALMFQNRLWAVAERALPQENAARELMADLDSFRLGWLPHEKMQEAGGYSVTPVELPAEAEGFQPLYICGSGADLLQGYGVCIEPEGKPGLHVCRGIFYGYSLRRE